MTTEPTPTPQEHKKTRVVRAAGASEAVYGFGLIGAWIYFFSHATTFWVAVLAFFKGIVWPAMLVYEALKFLQM